MTNETKSAKQVNSPGQEEIATYAYYLWEADGCQQGRDVDYWLQAKAHLMADRQFEAGLLSARTQKSLPPPTGVIEESGVAKVSKRKKTETPRSGVSSRETAFA